MNKITNGVNFARRNEPVSFKSKNSKEFMVKKKGAKAPLVKWLTCYLISQLVDRPLASTA